MIELRGCILRALTIFILIFSFQPFTTNVRAQAVQTVKIGVILPSEFSGEYSPPLISFAQEDINEYMVENGYDYRFEFIIENAMADSDLHLEHVKSFHLSGVDLIIGGGWSIQAQGSLDYINENNIIMLSHGSVSPILAMSDNLYRLCPNDYAQGPVLAEMLSSWGIEKLIVIQRDDAWANGIYDTLEVEYSKTGGIILKRIQYPPETTDFTDYLSEAEAAASEGASKYGSSRVGVMLLSFSEAVSIVNQVQSYPTLWSLWWFGSDGTARSMYLIEDAPEAASYLGLFSILTTAPESTEYRQLETRYTAESGYSLGYYDSLFYDACWLYALSVLEAGSDNALDVKAVIEDVASTYEGVSGICTLDENGDRLHSDYDIWGYNMEDGAGVHVRYGFYDYLTGKVTWDTSKITLPTNDAPWAEANGPYSSYVNEPILFSPAGSTDIDGTLIEYRWDFGDSSIFSYDETPTHSFSRVGIYTVTLRVKDNNDAVDEDTAQCIVSAIPNKAPIAIINGPYSGYANEPISFSSAGSIDQDGTITEYRWSFGEGGTDHYGDVQYFIYERAGTYTVTLTVKDEDGATSLASTSCMVYKVESTGGGSWSIEKIATILTICGTIIGVIGWLMKARAEREREKKLFAEFMQNIDDIYFSFKVNTRKCEAELYRIKDQVFTEFKQGVINAKNYNTLDERIEEYIKEIREEIEKIKASEKDENE